jgi:hypothetical protein
VDPAGPRVSYNAAAGQSESDYIVMLSEAERSRSISIASSGLLNEAVEMLRFAQHDKY